jgi:hypothetical protein
MRAASPIEQRMSKEVLGPLEAIRFSGAMRKPDAENIGAQCSALTGCAIPRRIRLGHGTVNVESRPIAHFRLGIM